MVGICFDNTVEYACKGMAKLHGIHSGQGEGLNIDTTEGVIEDGAGVAVALGDDPNWAEPET